MRRITIVTLLLALAAIPLFAQGRGGRQGHFGPGLMPMLHNLNLTDDQKAQIKALADSEKSDDRGKVGELEQKLHAAILEDQPDLQAIEGLKTALNAAHAEALERRIEHMQKLAQILTPDQRKQLLDMKPGQGRGTRGQAGGR
jgi:Spy/CpxP family protein refolding chaperone